VKPKKNIHINDWEGVVYVLDNSPESLRNKLIKLISTKKFFELRPHLIIQDYPFGCFLSCLKNSYKENIEKLEEGQDLDQFLTEFIEEKYSHKELKNPKNLGVNFPMVYGSDYVQDFSIQSDYTLEYLILMIAHFMKVPPFCIKLNGHQETDPHILLSSFWEGRGDHKPEIFEAHILPFTSKKREGF
jgi:hypothetical protein